MSQFWQQRSWSVAQRIVIYGAAAVLLLLALRWLYVFGLTDYRSHRRPLMIPLAGVILLLAFGLFRLSSIAVWLLVALAVVVGAGALYFQLAEAYIQPFLSTVVVASVICVGVLVPRLIKSA